MFKDPFKKNIFYILIITALVFASYIPVIKADFLDWDDDHHIQDNLQTARFSIQNTVDIFQSTVLDTYVPLTVFSFNLERKLFGLNPFFFHLNNLSLHILVTILVFYFTRLLGLSLKSAFFSALIFGIHPIHVESVAWISERKDVLYALFYMLSLIFYWRFLQNNKWPYYIFSIVCAFFSVLAKPMALSLPWILLLLNYIDGKPWRWKNLFDKIPFFIAVESITWITYSLHARTAATMDWSQGPLIWVWSASFYIKKFFFPFSLSPLYLLPEPVSLTQPVYLLSAIIFALFVLSLFLFRKNRWWVFAALFYCGSAFFLWRFDRLDTSIVADRFMYLPCLGFCLFLGLSLDRILNRTKPSKSYRFLVLGALFFLFAGMATLTFKQTQIWKNNDSLWEFVMAKYPDSTIAYNNKGAQLSKSGNYEEAMEYFYKSIELNPRNKEAFYNIGYAATMLDQYELALEFFGKTIALDPLYAKAYGNRGLIFYNVKKDPEKALADYNKALEIEPDLITALIGRGLIYDRELKKYDLALADFNKVISIDRSNADAYNYRGSILCYIKYEYDKAIKDFTSAVALDQTYAEAFLNRGYCYKQLKQFDNALQNITKAIDLMPQAFEGYVNRGSLYRELNNFDMAVKDYSKAIELGPQNLMALFLRAELYTDLNKLDLALSDYNEIIKKSPQNAKGFYLRSAVYHKLKKPQEALNDALKAQSLGFDVKESYLSELQKALTPRKPAP